MGTFSFNEGKYYSAALSLGVQNVLRNGFALGWKKTIGKIVQPINSYSRFPEYCFFGEAIQLHLENSLPSARAKILDVGSPKPFGLLLAHSSDVELEMTDISLLNISEYQLLWEAVRQKAKGVAHFSIQDARSLNYESNHFDIVYSMSVLEHVQGPNGDAKAVKELVRVLKPGGLFLFSVPYGNSYVEQRRQGFSGAVEKRCDNIQYFFQRIYDRSRIESRLLPPLNGVRIRSQSTVWRSRPGLLRQWANLGENLNGLFGFLNPWISRWVNRSASGLAATVPSSYTEVYSPSDIYGDALVAAAKS